MVVETKAYYICSSQTEREGKRYSKVTLYKDNETIEMPMDNQAYAEIQVGKVAPMKEIGVSIALGKYKDIPNFKCLAVTIG